MAVAAGAAADPVTAGDTLTAVDTPDTGTNTGKDGDNIQDGDQTGPDRSPARPVPSADRPVAAPWPGSHPRSAAGMGPVNAAEPATRRHHPVGRPRR